jgi:hypothetical protein
MRKIVIAAGAAALVLTSCANPGPPPKQQPGSWTTKIDILSMEGKDADKARAGMEQMFKMMGAMSVCVTPELAAKDDPATSVEKLGGGANGQCTWEKKDVSSAGVHLVGTCRDGGRTVKITSDGTLTATDRDITTTIEGYDANGTKEGSMKTRTHATRNGECTAKDMTAPAMGM